MLVVIISFVIFNIESLEEIYIFIKNMLCLGNLPFANFETIYHLKNYAVILVIAVICSTPFIKKVGERIAKIENIRLLLNIIEIQSYVILLVVCTASLVSNSYNPFIYFRF